MNIRANILIGFFYFLSGIIFAQTDTVAIKTEDLHNSYFRLYMTMIYLVQVIVIILKEFTSMLSLLPLKKARFRKYSSH